jgi:predicted AlkP superfamily phosphohydrolase/phosphomutase
MPKQKLACRTLRFTVVVIIAIAFLNVNTFSKDPSDNKTKIFLIGIDGLEWSIIKKMVEAGMMPTFGELMKNGAYGDLKTLLKYTSPSLWTTIATGKNPEVHGITSHIVHEEGRYELVSPMSYHRKVKALWNILTDYGKKTGVINYPCTEPPEPVNGFIIPYSIVDIKDTFPNELFGEINLIVEESAKTAKEFFNDFKSYCDFQDDLSKEIICHLVDGEIWKVTTITSNIYEKFNGNLDLLMVYVWETDYISHIFWKFMKPDFFQHKSWELTPKNIKKFGSVIKDMYVMVDKFVKKLIEDVADENTTIIICSDHGFRSSPHHQKNGIIVPIVFFKNLNKLLEIMGFLQFKSDIDLKASSIDFTKTLAYHYQLDEPSSYPNVFISLNLKGRQANGIVEPDGEYARVKTELIAALSNLKIVETDESLFDEVVEVSLPQRDIRVTIKSDINLLEQHVRVGGDIFPLSDFYILLDKSGDHSDPGTLIIYGKNIRKVGLIKNAHILDIVPTILYLLDLPVAKDMKGNVLTQAIETDFLKRYPVKYIDSYETTKGAIREEFNHKPIKEQELEQLRSLGYAH